MDFIDIDEKFQEITDDSVADLKIIITKKLSSCSIRVRKNFKNCSQEFKCQDISAVIFRCTDMGSMQKTKEHELEKIGHAKNVCCFL